MSEETKDTAPADTPQECKPPRHQPKWLRDMERRLSAPGTKSALMHPLTLLLLGALISGVLIPHIGRQWQIHDKELEVKEEVVKDINTSLTDFVNEAQFKLLNKPGHSPQEFDQAFREWEVKRGQISTTLRIYYPESRFASDWDSFSAGVTHFYDLSATTDLAQREELARHLETCFVAEGHLADLHEPADSPEHWEHEVQILVEEIFEKKDHLVHDILYNRSDLWQLDRGDKDPPAPPADACHETAESGTAGG
jgi:hypothetical protein